MVEGVFIQGKGADPINLESLAPMRVGTNIYQHATGYDKEQESNTVLRGKGFIRKAGIAKKNQTNKPSREAASTAYEGLVEEVTLNWRAEGGEGVRQGRGVLREEIRTRRHICRTLIGS